jgi:UDPglucose 6-dehydrogenase
LLIVSPQAAELIKHSINGFLALSICYINELSKIANLNNIISKDLELGLKTENRIGPKSYLSVGNAYAGGTLARDVSFLTKISKQNNLKNYLIQSISKSNENQKKYIYNQFKKMKISKNKKILFLGLAYKKGTSTSRRSEAICFFDWLINNNYKNIRLHDPLIKGLEKKYQNYFSKNLSNDLKKTDCILVFYNQIFYKKYSKLINKLKKRILLFDPFSIFKPHKKLKLI